MSKIDERILEVSAAANISYYLGLIAINDLNSLGVHKKDRCMKDVEKLCLWAGELKNYGENLLDHENFIIEAFYPGADFNIPIVREFISKYVKQLKKYIEEVKNDRI